MGESGFIHLLGWVGLGSYEIRVGMVCCHGLNPWLTCGFSVAAEHRRLVLS
jgi:hypothetical protein